MLTTSHHWQTLERQRERVAAHRTEVSQRHGRACAQVAAVAAWNAEQPLPSTASEAEIAALADRRAALMRDRIAALTDPLQVADLLRWLNGHLEAMRARPFAFKPGRPEGDQLAGFLRRAEAPEWWRRQVRREVRRRAEAEAIHAGQVNAKAGAWYCSDETVRRRLAQIRRNAAILESTEL